MEDQLRMHYFSVQSSKHTQTHIVEALVSGSGILGPSSSLAVIGSEASGLTRQPRGVGGKQRRKTASGGGGGKFTVRLKQNRSAGWKITIKEK